MTEAQTLGELIDEAAVRFGPAPCLGFEGRWESFAETWEATDRVARGLVALGVKPGDKVALWMTNRPEWIHVMYALAKIGAIMVPVNTRFRTTDLDYILRQSDTSTLITMDESGPIRYLDMTLELCPELKSHPRDQAPVMHEFPELRRVISLGEQRAAGVWSWEEMLAAGEGSAPEIIRERQAAVRPGDTLYIMYTSGTTGFPKGAEQSHAVIRNARATADSMAMTPDDCTVMFLPLFHAFGFFEGALLTFVCGARMVLTEAFNPAEILRIIERERGSVIHGFDTHWQDLIDEPTRAERDLSSLRTGILACGAPSSVAVAERAQDALCPTITGYGMTEIMPGALLGVFGDTRDHSVRTSGRPSKDYEFRVIDAETGRDQPDGTPGEMIVRGYAVMKGYYKKPEETARDIDADGWFHTGDMGVREPDGYFRFLGRYKEMLKVGGENVDPMEVEAYFLGHPAVSKIQIIGVPDGRLSEIPIGFVILRPGHVVTEDNLRHFARGHIASYKIPRHFFFVDEFPMTSSGKVKRFELRHIARNELGVNAG